MGNLINPALMSNWENWLRIFLMVALGAVALTFSTRLISGKKEA